MLVAFRLLAVASLPARRALGATAGLGGLLAGMASACAPPVVVASAPPRAAAVTLTVTNTLGTPVNVYVTVDGAERLLGQVGSNATRALPVADVAPGTAAALRATRADGSTSYTRAGFVLERASSWRVP